MSRSLLKLLLRGLYDEIMKRKFQRFVTAGAFLMTLLLVSNGCTKRPFHMPSASMEPTIPAGSTVIADLRAYRSSDPERFDIVLFHPPTQDADRVFAFRVVGLPGEKIQIHEQGIKVDSTLLAPPNGLGYRPGAHRLPTILGPDEFFVVGDNTEHALDSRYWGPVPRSNIIGKVTDIQQSGDGNEDHGRP